MPVAASDKPPSLHGKALVASRTSSRELRAKHNDFSGKPREDFPGRPMEARSQALEPTETGFFENLLSGFNCRKSCSSTAGPYGYTGASFRDTKPSGYNRVATEIPEENADQQHTALHEARGWCGGPGGICFEAENVQKEVRWSFVGPGKGTWQQESDYSFVGKGMGGWDMAMTKGSYWKPKRSCIGLLVGITAAVAAGIWEWQYLQSQHLSSARGSKQPVPVSSSESENEMLNCTKHRHTWTKDWSVDKQRDCCKKYVRAGPRSAYNCSTEADNWRLAWSATKKAWCCEHSTVGCQLPPSHRKWMSAVPNRQLTRQRIPHHIGEVFDCKINNLRGWTNRQKAQREWCCKGCGVGCPH